MTDVYRIFDVDTRAIKNTERRYAGQAYDSIATTLHFEYNPPDFLDRGMAIDSEYYVPYIMFDVYDEDGTPLVYSSGSNPRFDGYTFTIPWDVTSRVKTNRLNFQLFFVKNGVEFDGDIAKLNSTQYILSEIGGLAWKPTIKGIPPGADNTSTPTTEPNLMGWIQYFKNWGLIAPVTQTVNENGRTVLHFKTYDGVQNTDLVLDVASLVDGKVPIELLNTIKEWGLESDENLATAKLVKDTLDSKLDDSQLKDEWSVPPTKEEIPSARLVKQDLDSKLDDSQLVKKDWTETPSEDNIPSEKLVKDNLDQKVNRDQITDSIEIPSSDKVPSTKLLATELDKKLDDVQLVTAWQTPVSDTNIPSEKLVKDNLDLKTDKVMAIPEWDENTTYNSSSTVISESVLYISTSDNNSGNRPGPESSAWIQIQGGGGGGSGGAGLPPYKEKIGDGKKTRFIINHRRGSEFFYQIRSNVGKKLLYVDADVYSLNPNEAEVVFTTPPGMEEYTIIITSGISGGGGSGEVNIVQDESGITINSIQLQDADSTHDGLMTKEHVAKLDAPTTVNTTYVDNVLTTTVNGVSSTVNIQAGGGGAKVNSFQANVGDGVKTEFVLEHNFGTRDFTWSVRSNSAPYDFIQTEIQATDENNATIVFSKAPALDEFRVILISAE